MNKAVWWTNQAPPWLRSRWWKTKDIFQPFWQGSQCYISWLIPRTVVCHLMIWLVDLLNDLQRYHLELSVLQHYTKIIDLFFPNSALTCSTRFCILLPQVLFYSWTIIKKDVVEFVIKTIQLASAPDFSETNSIKNLTQPNALSK